MGEAVTEFERKALARIDIWRAKADDLMRCAKAYNCRSQEAVRTGYIKQAAQARMCAEELERDYAESANARTQGADNRADQDQDAGQVIKLDEGLIGSEAPQWPSPDGAEPADQGA